MRILASSLHHDTCISIAEKIFGCECVRLWDDNLFDVGRVGRLDGLGADGLAAGGVEAHAEGVAAEARADAGLREKLVWG